MGLSPRRIPHRWRFRKSGFCEIMRHGGPSWDGFTTDQQKIRASRSPSGRWTFYTRNFSYYYILLMSLDADLFFCDIEEFEERLDREQAGRVVRNCDAGPRGLNNHVERPIDRLRGSKAFALSKCPKLIISSTATRESQNFWRRCISEEPQHHMRLKTKM